MSNPSASERAPGSGQPKQGAEREREREVLDGSRGRESGLSGLIIYEEGYAGETALLIRVPKKGLGGNHPGESRRDFEVWGQEGKQEKRGKKKKAGAPSVQARTGGGSQGWNFKGG